MESKIKNQFNEEILKDIIHRFNLNYSDTKQLKGFESFIYFTKKDSQKYVLRISHTHHRTKKQILSELEFLIYLNKNNLNVPKVLKSTKENLVEEIKSKDGSFLACLFEFIDGIEPTNDLITNDLIKKMGAFSGNLHKLSKKYDSNNIVRPDFVKEVMSRFNFIPKKDVKIREIANRIINKIKQIPKSNKNFGLIHSDFHFGNFLIRDEKIVLFDFDDCQYSWFIYEIAISLFYYLPHNKRNDAINEKGHNFLRQYLIEYKKTNNIENEMLIHLEDFMKLREIELYALIHRSFENKNLPEWPKSFMKDRKERIENEIPYFKIDINKL